MSSPHTVANRQSLAYKMFVLAAESRDRWLRNQNVGDFSATVQKYYTGMSLSRYIFLVCIEFPLVLAASLLTWCFLPASLIFMVARVSTYESQIGLGNCILYLIGFILLALVSGVILVLLYAAILAWASSKPNRFTRFFKRHLFHLPEEEIEKFPGPVTLLKKWVLSTAKGGPAQITWDSGRRRDIS